MSDTRFLCHNVHGNFPLSVFCLRSPSAAQMKPAKTNGQMDGLLAHATLPGHPKNKKSYNQKPDYLHIKK